MTLIPPPFDPELADALEACPPLPTEFSQEELDAARRSAQGYAPSDEDLRRAGFFDVGDHAAPGAEGAPDVPLPVCRPAAARRGGARPVFYYTHGGGMMTGTNRLGVETVLDWAQQLDAEPVAPRVDEREPVPGRGAVDQLLPRRPRH